MGIVRGAREASVGRASGGTICTRLISASHKRERDGRFENSLCEMRPFQRHQDPAKVDRGGPRFLVTRTHQKNRYFKGSDQLIGNAPEPHASQASMTMRGHHHAVSPDVLHVLSKRLSYRATEHRTGERPPHTVSQAAG